MLQPNSLPVRLPLLLAAVLLLGVGCDTSTEPLPVDLALDGELTADASFSSFFTVPRQGTVRFELESLDVEMVAPERQQAVAVGISIGVPSEGECVTNYQFLLTGPGDFELVALSAGERCIRIFDPGPLNEDDLITFTLLVSGI